MELIDRVCVVLGSWLCDDGNEEFLSRPPHDRQPRVTGANKVPRSGVEFRAAARRFEAPGFQVGAPKALGPEKTP